MKKYSVKNCVICEEEKTFIDDKSKNAIEYKEYSLCIEVNGNTILCKIDKSDKKKLETLATLNLIEVIK